MADDVRLNQNTTTGDLIAADEIGGTKHQRVKLQIGADGVASDVHGGNPLPISGSVGITGALPAGGNNIGDVDVLSLPALPAGNANIGDVDVASMPALAATTDAVVAKLASDALHDGLTALTPKFANIATATSGDTTLVTAVVGNKIRVVALSLIAAGDVNAYFKDDTTPTPNDLMGDATNNIDLTANMGFVLPFNPVGWFETATGEGLVLDLDAAVRVAGCLTYVEV